MSEITTADTKNKQTLGYLHIKTHKLNLTSTYDQGAEQRC